MTGLITSLGDVARAAARCATSGSCWAATTTVRTALGTPHVVLDRHLGLAVGSQVGQLTALPDLRQAPRQAVGERDRQRHELGRLAAGEAEHHPLVAGAQLARRGRVLANLERPLHARAMSGDCSLTETSVPQVW